MTELSASSVATVLGSSRRISWVLWILVVGTSLVLLLLDPVDGLPHPGAWLTWVLIAGAAAAAFFPLGDSLPAGWTGLAAGLSVVAAAGVFWDPPTEVSGYAPWGVRSSASVLMVLVLRGRPAVAWIAMALFTAVIVLWAAVTGNDVARWIGVISRQLATLVAIQVTAFGLSRATRTIVAYRAEQRERVRSEELRAAAIRERRAELAAVRALSMPLLTRIAAGEDTPALRAKAVLAEAGLRDVLRGRRLAGEPLTTAALEARRRGVEVTLLDDLGDGDLGAEELRSEQRTEALTWAAERVRASAGATATVRLSRTAGRALVTMLAGDGDVATREL